MKIEGLNINKAIEISVAKEIKGYNNSLNAESLSSKEPNTNKSNLHDLKNENNTAIFYKAFFAVDENKNVVIKVVDSDGNLIRQIPPEEFLKVAESLKNVTKKLLHLEV